MNAPTVKQYKAMHNELTNLMQQVDKVFGKHWAEEKYTDAIRIVSASHATIKALCLSEMAKFLTENKGDKFTDTDYYHQPSYYGYDVAEVRSHADEETYRKFSDIDCTDLYWESLEMSDYYAIQDTERFIENLPENAKEIGVTVLCTTKKGPYGMSELDIPDSEIHWGNTVILSSEDWVKCQELDTSEWSDLVWRDVQGYDKTAIANVVAAIDTSYSRWSGNDEGDEDCILYRLQTLHDRNETIGFTLSGNISKIMKNGKLDYNERFDEIEELLCRVEDAEDERDE